MEAHVTINDQLFQDALSVSGLQDKERLIEEALKEYIKIKKQKDLTELAGHIEFAPDFDHKKMRVTRI